MGDQEQTGETSAANTSREAGLSLARELYRVHNSPGGADNTLQGLEAAFNDVSVVVSKGMSASTPQKRMGPEDDGEEGDDEEGDRTCLDNTVVMLQRYESKSAEDDSASGR